MLVWRIEDENHYGFYAKWKSGVTRDYTKDVGPCSFCDVPELRSRFAETRHGFISLCQLHRWFAAIGPDKPRWPEGWFLACYEVPSRCVDIAKHQCQFDADCAELLTRYKL